MKKWKKLLASVLLASVILDTAVHAEEMKWVMQPSGYDKGLCQSGDWLYDGYSAYYYGAEQGVQTITVPKMINGTIVDGFESVYSFAGYGTKYALYNRDGLPDSVKTIKLHKYISSIDEYSGESGGDSYNLKASSLEKYKVDPGNPYFTEIDGVLVSKKNSLLVHYPAGKKGKKYVVPEEIRVIGTGAFDSCRYLETVVIPAGVETVSLDAFRNCPRLKKIYISSPTHVVLGDEYLCRWGSKVTIYCEKGSTAEKFAKENKIKCKTSSKLQGVTSVKVRTTDDSKASLSWGKVSGASGYEIYRSATKDGLKEKVKTISGKTKTSYSEKLDTADGAWYWVCAFQKSGKEKLCGAFSKPVFVLAAPEKVKSVKVKKSGAKELTVTWKSLTDDDTERCSGYIIYRYDSAGKKYIKIATVKGSESDSYVDSGLKTGKKYTYKVRAYWSYQGQKAYGEYSKKAASSKL